MTNLTNTPARRDTIAELFNTDSLTTHRILQNTNWGFFRFFFEDQAEEKWIEAHTWDGSLQYHLGVRLEFVKNNFEAFASHAFTTSAGWGPLNEKTRRVEWEYKSWFRKEPIKFNTPAI